MDASGMSFGYYMYSEKKSLFKIWTEISQEEAWNRKVCKGR